MQFPDRLFSETRWLVRPKRTGKVPKQPISVFETRPFDYEAPPGDKDCNDAAWRWRWNCEPIHATYAAARSYLDRHGLDYEGLAFVVHHFRDVRPKTRLICLDFDHCIDALGGVDPEALAEIERLNSYSEYSRGGDGIHVFVEVTDCPAFRNILTAPIGSCTVDVLCANPVAVTGKPFGEFRQVSTISWDELDRKPYFVYKIPKELDEARPDWWNEDPYTDVLKEHEFLIEQMQIAEAVEGQGGSQVLYAAACELARHGVVGRAAEPLLRLVPASPPFPASQIRRVIECAYDDVVHCDQFATCGIEHEFEKLEGFEERKGYGFTPISVKELATKDVRIEWLVEGAFTTEGSLFIGGREKCFKTGIVVDLLVSLATTTPFLGKFAVPNKKKSVLFTAEIGIARAKSLIESICVSKGVEMGSVDGMDIVESVPSFAVNPRTKDYDDETKRALAGLTRYFQDAKPDLAVFDPLYFAMGGASVGDMYEIGTVLKKISKICSDCKVQPVFCHHARKNGEKDLKPMDLGDLYGSGVSAFARQWLLLAHAEPFRNGQANLYGNIGGSSQGSRGLWRIKIDEGEPDELMERRWGVEVGETEGIKEVSEEALLDAFRSSDDGSTGGYRANRNLLSIYLDVSSDDICDILKPYIKSGKVGVTKSGYIWKGDGE